jgi:SAM-dependent methyltransferase
MDDAAYYRGIRMMSAAGVHEEVERVALERFAPEDRPEIEALDLGAGAGALSQRLIDAGFTKLSAWDLDPHRFVVNGAVARGVDLNEPFPSDAAGRYQLVTAVEVIEHLENPYAFMREVARVLSPEGILLLTTPNIEGTLSRLKFLLKGEFRWFGEDDYQAWGHIQPLTSWQLDKALRQSGLCVLERSYNLRDAVLVLDNRPRTALAALGAALLTPLLRGQTRGDINVWAIGHASAQPG